MMRAWSCDTVVALPDATASGRLLFGKNSDRPAGETQPLRSVPARAAGAPLQLAYVTIPDAPAFAHVGSAPFWCWGYEMGVNEHRVVIGNEALFTRTWAEAVERETKGEPGDEGILGMELVRLGLERGENARAALDVITGLLSEYGQWGSATFGAPHAEGAYDNSFLIADPHEAWVLETFGREWAARRLTSGVESISNEISTRANADLTSPGLAKLATESGWWTRDPERLDVADAYTDPQTPLQVSHIRRRRSLTMLQHAASNGGVSIPDVRAVLSDHLEDTFLGGPYFDASRPDFHTICMHEHPAGFTWGNTAASLIVELHDDPERPVVLWWAPVTPCTSVYLPVFVGVDLPAGTDQPGLPESFDPREHGRPAYSPDSVWWQWQHLLDVVKDPRAGAFDERAGVVRERFAELERRWRDSVPDTTEPTVLAEFSAACAAEATSVLRELVTGFGADMNEPIDPRWRAGHP